ncbi:MAG: RsmE family RNA methyltransferase [Acidimicrobiia bacterium]|nr:RsmE family RNA methyltransferase [Acidimicrobiia bacterium]
MTSPAGDGLGPTTAEALVFVADLDRPELSAPDAHHLRRVLRLRRGAPIAVGDGSGRWRVCSFGDRLVEATEIVHEPEPTPVMTVAFSIPKAEKPELVVQKLTELGTDRIVLLQADRTVVRWEGDKVHRHMERLHRVAREAAMQARRPRLPEVLGPLPFGVAATWPGATRCDQGGGPVPTGQPTMLVGPEGGWTERERAQVQHVVGLAPYVLRVETAAIAAGALLAAFGHNAWLADREWR